MILRYKTKKGALGDRQRGFNILLYYSVIYKGNVNPGKHNWILHAMVKGLADDAFSTDDENSYFDNEIN